MKNKKNINNKILSKDLKNHLNLINNKIYPSYYYLINFLKTEHIQNVICLGIGDPCSNNRSRNQLSFIKSICDECLISKIFFYDPITCLECNSNIKDLNIKIMNSTNGEILIEEKTLFFMPNCPKFLFNNIISTNWSIDLLLNLYFLGNSFNYYIEFDN